MWGVLEVDKGSGSLVEVAARFSGPGNPFRRWTLVGGHWGARRVLRRAATQGVLRPRGGLGWGSAGSRVGALM